MPHLWVSPTPAPDVWAAPCLRGCIPVQPTLGMGRGGIPSGILLRIVIPCLKGLSISHCPCLERVLLFPCSVHHPFPRNRFGDSFVLLPSVLAALSSASPLWKERIKGTSFLLPCLHGELSMCCPSLSKGRVQDLLYPSAM